MITTIPPSTPCSFPGCDQPGTCLAQGEKYDWLTGGPGHPEVAIYCELHAKQVADEDCVEYRAKCPNCGCRFGVGYTEKRP